MTNDGGNSGLWGERGTGIPGCGAAGGISVDLEQILGATTALCEKKLTGMERLPDVGAIEGAIVVVRGQRVMLDSHLAQLYGVQTERLNQQVRRNQGRFPPDFAFRLSSDEWQGMYLQIAGTLQRSRRTDRLPVAFTEHGCLMASNLLRSPRAVAVSVLILRAFVRMRSALAANAELAARVDELTRAVERQGGELAVHDAAISKLLAEIRRLTRFPEPPRREIGFTAPWRGGK